MKKVKKTIALFMAVVIVFSGTLIARAQSPEELGLVPVRATLTDMGGIVTWQYQDATIHVSLADSSLVFRTCQPIVYINNDPMPLQDGITLWEDMAFMTQSDLLMVIGHVPFAGTVAVAVSTTEMLMEALDIPGLTMAIVHHDTGFTWTRGFGYADVERGIQVDENTLFDTGSVIKMFNAIAIMQMVEQGIIDLDEPLVTYLPNFFVQPHPVHGGDYRDITPRMLLAHISGIEGDFFGGMYSLGEPYPGVMNNAMARMAQSTMNNTQMNRMSYANAGTVMLGILTATMAGHEDYFHGFWQHIEENVWTPAGMYTTTFVPGAGANRALPYIAASLPVQEHTYVNPISAGGMFTSAAEMAGFMHIILAGGGDIVSQASLDEMFTIQLDNEISGYEMMQFGLGTHSIQWPNGLVTQGHDGGTTHYLTSMQFHFDSGIGIFLSTNSQTGGGAFQAIMYTVMTAAVQEVMGDLGLLEPLPPGEPVERTREELEVYAGYYPVFGRLIINEAGNLQFDSVPGVPFPLEFIPYADGSFGTVLGVRFWFKEVDGSMAIFQGDHPISITAQRIDGPWQADENFNKWVGTFEYYVETQGSWPVVHSITLYVDENGYAYADSLGMSSPINRIDDYTFYVLGSGRNTGLVLRLSEEDGQAWLHMSGTRFVRL